MAYNPIVQTICAVNPFPGVYSGTLYLYIGQNEYNDPNNRCLMHDYRCFSTTDMVNWTDPGVVFALRKAFARSDGEGSLLHVGEEQFE